MPKVFVFDVESDGLDGVGFAVGAIVIENGRLIDRFEGRVECEIKSHWVKENVLPYIEDMEVYPSMMELRDAFWKFWLKHKDGALMFADCCVPVESNFLAACKADAPQEREWQGPYPLHDVASVLLAKGLDPHLDRLAFAVGEDDTHPFRQHNPCDDAEISAIVLCKVMGWGE
jgi:hypothetical protein